VPAVSFSGIAKSVVLAVFVSLLLGVQFSTFYLMRAVLCSRCSLACLAAIRRVLSFLGRLAKWNKKAPASCAKDGGSSQQVPLAAVAVFFVASFCFLIFSVFYSYKIVQEAVFLVERSVDVVSTAEIDASLKDQAKRGMETVFETVRGKLDQELAARFPSQNISLSSIYSQFRAVFHASASTDASQNFISKLPNVARLLQLLRSGSYSQLMNPGLLYAAFSESKSFALDTVLGVFQLDPGVLLHQCQDAD
jgi:hypothetical protein